MNFHLLNFIGGDAEISEIDISNQGKQDQSYLGLFTTKSKWEEDIFVLLK